MRYINFRGSLESLLQFHDPFSNFCLAKIPLATKLTGSYLMGLRNSDYYERIDSL